MYTSKPMASPEQQEGPQINAANNDVESKNTVTDLLGKYKDQLRRSKLFEVDKKQLIRLLDTKPAHELKAEHLASNIAYISTLEKGAEADISAYTEKIKRINDQGKEKDGKKLGLVLVSDKATKEYLEWLGTQTYDERQKLLKQPFYKEAERITLAKDFARVPEAERKACVGKLNGIGGLEEKQKFVAELLRRHEALKAAFLKLPEAVQSKNKDKFVSLTLDEREKFLKTLGTVAPAGNGEKQSEGAERQKNITAFDEKMKGLVKDNLFAPLSMPAYQVWFKGLSLEQQRKSLAHSDLDNPERRTVRDRFMALTPEQRKVQELRFRNADLDKRKEILASIRAPAGAVKNAPKEEKNSYPPEVMEKTIQTAMHDPHVLHQRLLLTMLDESLEFKQRAKVRYDAEHADVTVKKAAERGNEVDERQVIHMETLTRKAESRFSLKRFLRGKEEKGREKAVANNMMFTDAGHKEISIEEFKEHAMKHQREEAIAAIINISTARLPGMDREQMRKNLEKRNLHVNLRDAIAA